MRKLATLVLVGGLLALALPAGAAKPSTSHLVTWTVDGGTVTLDTKNNMVTLDVDATTSVSCGGASTIAAVVWSGSAVADVTLDKQGRSGTFVVESNQLTMSTVSACGGTSANSLSGTFEADKGKALDRGRDATGRFVERTGVGALIVGSTEVGVDSVLIRTTVSQ